MAEKTYRVVINPDLGERKWVVVNDRIFYGGEPVTESEWEEIDEHNVRGGKRLIVRAGQTVDALPYAPVQVHPGLLLLRVGGVEDPPPDAITLYAKDDGLIYTVDEDGNDVLLGGSGGPAGISQADADARYLLKTDRGAPDGVAELVSNRLPNARLPSLAINDVQPVGSQAAMLALDMQRGDMAIRTDFSPNRSYMLTADDPTQLVNWTRVTFGDVVSVNSQTGVINLTAADVGALTQGQASALYAALIHASRHASGGADPIAPSSIGAADLTHASRHYSGGADPVTPAAIGALTQTQADARYAALATSPQVNNYNTPGTYTYNKPPTAKIITFVTQAGSGGGGAGRRGAAGTVRGGGGSGAGGGRTIVEVDASLLPDTFTIVVGAAGVGGASATTDDTNGGAGTAGGASYVSTGAAVYVAHAAGGAGGNGGTASGASAVGAGTGLFNGSVGLSSSSTGAAGSAGTGAPGGASGGSGGGVNTSNVDAAGGVGSRSYGSLPSNSGTAGAAGGGTGGNGVDAHVASTLCGGSGGGGGGNASGAGGAGGNGGLYGAGGGGGGGCLNGFPSGAGGNGTVGFVRAVAYF